MIFPGIFSNFHYRYSPVLLTVFFLCSCVQQKRNEGLTRVDTYKTNPLPIPLQKDSGHTRFADLKKLHPLEKTEESGLENFMRMNFKRQRLVLLNDQALVHSEHIDQRKQVQIDSFRNDKTIIVSRYTFGEILSQSIFIDGKLVSDFHWNGNDIIRQVIFDFDESSFIHFSFAGRPFYYIQAGETGLSGGSASLVRYHLFYDPEKNQLSEFANFRVDDVLLFGDVNHDDQLDFLNIQNEGGYGIDSTNEFIATLYSYTSSGKFEELKDQRNQPYFINGNSGTNYYVGDEMKIDSYFWPVPIYSTFSLPIPVR